MFLTVLIESHAKLSLCMQMHTLLSSISSEGWVWGRRAPVYSPMSSLTDFSLMCCNAQCHGSALVQPHSSHVLNLHTMIQQPISFNCHLITVSDGCKAEGWCLTLFMHSSIQHSYGSTGFLHLQHFLFYISTYSDHICGFSKDTASNWALSWPLAAPRENRLNHLTRVRVSNDLTNTLKRDSNRFAY